jgi:WD40 repeat protein
LLYDATNPDLPTRTIAAGPGIVDMALHPDSDRIAVARLSGDAPWGRRDYEVQVWDIAADEAVYTLTSAADLVPVVADYRENLQDDDHNRELTTDVTLSGQVEWSANGDYLLVGSTLGAWVYEADAPNWVVRTESPFVGGGWKMLTGEVTDVAFAPDSNTFAIAFNSEIYLYDIETILSEHAGVAPPFGFNQQLERNRRSLMANQDAAARDNNYRVQGLAFGPEGTRIALGDDLGNVQLFNLELNERRSRVRDFDLENIETFEADVWGVWDIAFSPDGTRVIAAEGGGSIVSPEPVSSRSTLSEFAAVGLTLTNAVTLDNGELRAVAYSPDGTRLAVSGTAGVVVLDAATLDVLAEPVFSR